MFYIASICKKINYFKKLFRFTYLFTFFILSFLNFILSDLSYASYGLSASTGSGCHRIFPLRIGIQKEFDCYFRTERSWLSTGYWEASAYSLKGSKKRWPGCNDRLAAFAFAGVLRFERKEPICCVWPYVDVGVGLSYVNKKEMCKRELGIHFQFEDRLGLGIRFGECRQFELGYRVVHFSNAYLSKQNASINLHLIVLGYWFN